MTNSIAVIFILSILVVIILFFTNFKKPDLSWKKQVKQKIEKINKVSNNSDPNLALSSLVEADKLLDFTMIKCKFSGNTMGERLKNSQKRFEKELYQKIWEAHKLRNKAVHEMEFQPKSKDIKVAVSILIKAVKSLI